MCGRSWAAAARRSVEAGDCIMMFRATSYAFLLAATAWGQTSRHPKPAAPKDFAVMAWGGSPSDAEQLRGMREAGLNISGFCRIEDLDSVRAAGLTCFVSAK